MKSITVKLSEGIATRVEAEHISEEELNAFLMAAVKAWLMRREGPTGETHPAWSDAFQESAVAFVDQLISENQALFDELARL